MTPAPVARRELDYESFEALLADVDRLHANGYERAGNWDLAQACIHVAEWMQFTMDGFPVRGLPRFLRETLGKWYLRRMLRKRRMPTGIKSPVASTIPAPGGDEQAAINTLRSVVSRFREHEGPYLPSPVFGTMTREQCQQFHLLHCAHHLSFLVPTVVDH